VLAWDVETNNGTNNGKDIMMPPLSAGYAVYSLRGIKQNIIDERKKSDQQSRVCYPFRVQRQL